MRRLRTGFTTRASCLLAAGLTAVLCGLVLGEVDLLRAGVLAAVIPCVAAVVVQRTQVRIASRRSVSPSRVVAGDSVTLQLTITNGSPLPTGSLMLEDQLPDQFQGNARFLLESLGAREVRSVSYRIPHLDRGHYRVGPLRVRLTDPFGMIDLTRSFTTVSEFAVTPTIDVLPPAALPHADDRGDTGGSHSIGTHGADDASTREYRIGDDLRKIHWRSTARTGAIMVRQEERPWRGSTTLLLDLRGGGHAEVPAGHVDVPADPSVDTGIPTGSAASVEPDAAFRPDRMDPRLRSSLEWSVSAAASIGTHVLGSGQRFAMITDATARDAQRYEGPDQLAGHLALVRAQQGVDLARLVARARDSARESSLIAVLGRLDDAALDRLVSVPRRRGSLSLCGLLLDVESWAHPDAPPARHGVVHVDAAAAVLRNAGWRIAVVHRGEPTALAWRLLFAGAGTGAPTPVGAVR